MPEPASTRLDLVGPSGTDPIADGDDVINAIIARLEAVGAGFQQGTSRPAAAAALQGYFYVHTGTSQVSYCTGSAWLDIQMSDSDLALYAAATAPGAQLGLNDGTTVRRGKSIIATEESRTNTAYGLLATPDRVQNIVLPADGLILVAYQAMWKEASAGAAAAALFLDSDQIKRAVMGNVSPLVQAASMGGTTDTYTLLSTVPTGLQSYNNAVGYLGDVATGQVIGDGSIDNAFGGACIIFAAAGTYDVSVQFKAATGSVTAKNRKLWVWTLGF